MRALDGATGERMRAWQVQAAGEPAEVLHLVERDAPEPGPGEVRIRVTAAGLGLPDVFMCRGTYPLTPPLPFTSGQEATGVVTALGEGVDRLAVGDHVMCVTSFIGGTAPSPRSASRSPTARSRCPTASPRPRPPASGSRTSPDGSDSSTAAASPKATSWSCSAPRAGAASPRCSSGMRSAPVSIAVVSDDEKAAFCRGLGRRRHAEPPRGSGRAAPARAHRWPGVDLVYDPVGGDLAEDAAGAWPATDACSRSGSRADGGRRSTRTTS